MTSVRERVLYELSRRMIKPPNAAMHDMGAYTEWRGDHLAHAWSRFDDQHVTGKDVLDFGSGQGNLAFYLAQNKRPRRMVGVELHGPSVARAQARAAALSLPEGVSLEFLQGRVDGLPVPDERFDTLLAFDCMEHVMQPRAVLLDWHRVLRPGGRALLEWYPYLNPWGPHMEALIPVPWAHLIFGQRAMMRTAERIYAQDDYQPRAWDLTDDGAKAPNKWRQWETFREQGYINELTIPTFRRMVQEVGFSIARLDRHGFWAEKKQAPLGQALASLPAVGELFTSFCIIELVRR
jgi:SAM-dependent methyltransferase